LLRNLRTGAFRKISSGNIYVKKQKLRETGIYIFEVIYEVQNNIKTFLGTVGYFLTIPIIINDINDIIFFLKSILRMKNVAKDILKYANITNTLMVLTKYKCNRLGELFQSTGSFFCVRMVLERLCRILKFSFNLLSYMFTKIVKLCRCAEVI
jgi:hypothetical protein